MLGDGSGLSLAGIPASQGRERTLSAAGAEISLERSSPRTPRARPAAPRTCRGPHAGLSGGLAGRAHRWRRLGRRGPRGDVTSSAPGGRNRAAAAAVAQQRAAAAQRAGVATTSRAPGTRRQSERPTEGRGTGSPSPLPPRGAPAHRSLATWSSPQFWPPQVRELGEGAKSPPLTSSSMPTGVSAPAAWRLPAGPGAGACMFSQPAPREPTLPSWRAVGARPRDPGSAKVPRPGPGLRVKAGAPWLGARVCSRDWSDLAGVRSAAQNLWGRARSPRRARRPCRRRSSDSDPERSRRARRAAVALLALVPLALGCRRACSLPPPSSFAGKLASPCCSPKGPLLLAWPSLRQSPLRLG